MKYIKVKWLNNLSDTPDLLYSELDHELWEIRKVEIYTNGKIDFANTERRSGSTKLGIEPLPPLEQIAADPEFELSIISAPEFESVWDLAKKSNDI